MLSFLFWPVFPRTFFFFFLDARGRNDCLLSFSIPTKLTFLLRQHVGVISFVQAGQFFSSFRSSAAVTTGLLFLPMLSDRPSTRDPPLPWLLTLQAPTFLIFSLFEVKR